MKNNLEGKFTGSFVSSETGKHKITADGLEKFIFLNIFNNKELQKVLSTDEKIKKFAAINKNISINWYNERGIELARIYNDNIFFGKNWIGFYEKKKLKDGFYSRQSLIPWFLLLPFIIILFLLIWYRESKNS